MIARKRSRSEWIDVGFVPVILLVLVVVLATLSKYFFTARNLTEVLLQAAILGIVSVGTTFVIVDGDLDLSIGANVALSGVVCGMAMSATNNNIPIGILAGLGCGVLIGLINGLISTRLRVPAFVATLGMLVIGQGVALTLTNGASIANLPDAFGALANGNVLGLPALIWWMFLTFLAGYLVLHRTVFGIRTFAVGGNREAARLAGIRVDAVRVANFVISGLTGGIGGVLLAARVQAAQPTGGEIFTLYATAAYSNQQVAVGIVFIIAASSEFIRHR
jgi:ribose transport system permease protein